MDLYQNQVFSTYFYNQQNVKFFDEEMADPTLIDYPKYIQAKRWSNMLTNYQEMSWGGGGT